MKTFIIFDRKTGEILQTHVQPDDAPPSPEDLARLVRPDIQVDAVDVLAVDDLAPGSGYRVDVKARQLVAVEAGKVPGAGGAAAQPAGGDPQVARTMVSRVVRQRQP